MLAITVMKAMQIHSRCGLSRGSLANLYFAHSQAQSADPHFAQSNPRIVQIRALRPTHTYMYVLYMYMYMCIYMYMYMLQDPNWDA